MSTSLYPLLPPFVAIVILFAKLLINFGYKLGLVDKPNERSSHIGQIPRVGGISVFIPYLLLALLLFMSGSSFIESNVPYWIGLSFIIILGTIDDRLDLSSRFKFFIQFVISIYYVVMSGNHLDNLYGLFGIYELPSWFGLMLSIITVVYLINAVNLIDGADGLAAGTSLLSLYLFSSILGGNHHLFSFAFLGLGLIVFMGFNFSKNKKIFLGDAGSLGLGFVLATMAMEFLHSGNQNVENLNLNPHIAAILILGYPIADTMRVFVIRIAAGVSPFNADRRHMHHVLLDKGFSHFGTTTFIMFCVGSIVLMNKILAPIVDSHLIILLNIGLVLLIHMIVRHRFQQLRDFWRRIAHTTFKPISEIWDKNINN